MHHQEFTPPEALQDAVKCFWHNSRDSGEQLSGFEVMPDGYTEIIFYSGILYSPSYQDGLQLLPSPFMMGLLHQPALFNTKNRLEIIGIRCFPWTVFDLLGLPSGKEEMRTLEHPLAQLQAALEAQIHAGRIRKAIALVTQYFLQARSHAATDSLLFKAGAAMQKAAGTLSVGRVASAAHATVRTLERKFRQAAGHTVKDVSGLMRFEQVRNRLWLEPDSPLAGLAQELGYADQSHLSKEFRRYSGTTPAAFARKAKEAIGNHFVAFIQA